MSKTRTFKICILAPLAGLMLASSAQASLLITSIDMLIAETNFKVNKETEFGYAMKVFDSEYKKNAVCAQSLESLDRVGRKMSCDGARRNTGTLFTITGHNTGTSVVQFGLDWGRGGFSEIDFSGETEVAKYDENLWWAGKWNNRDVVTLTLSTVGDFTLSLLGFEDCCNGINSARYRSGDSGNSGLRESQWQILSVNAAAVPVPPVMWLFGLGLVGIAASRRTKNG